MGVADQQSNWSKCPFLALNGTAKLARSCPPSEAWHEAELTSHVFCVRFACQADAIFPS
jgi:hypothetical protein